jgi:hypothetical protein
MRNIRGITIVIISTISMLVVSCSKRDAPATDATPGDSHGHENDGTSQLEASVAPDGCTGECLPPAGCTSNQQCKSDEYCHFGETGCTPPPAGGSCKARPGGCDLLYDPVCGCDGKDYGNACGAHSAGTNVAYKGECGAKTCTTDADCIAGQQWCDGGTCVTCDNSGLACDLACSKSWQLYTRNGCSPCACAPVNQCVNDADCGAGQKCYAGAFCWDWCPKDDPSCCYGNICSAAGCSPPPPVGCWKRGCPAGQTCLDQGCSPSSCVCGGSSGWGCTNDCGGGTCS